MKKILFSIFAAAMLSLTSCISFDDPVTENYGNGPKVTITVNETTDSAFTFTIAPAEGTQWYSYLVDEASEAEDLTPATLLKGGYQSVAQAVVESAKAPTTTNDMRVKGTPICKPNTTYVIYAIAANDKGVTGEIATAVVTTTDKNAPEADTEYFEQGNAGEVAIYFSEAVRRGEGKVTAQYYKEFDFENPVDIPEGDITVEIDGGDVVIFSVSNVPAGAYVAYSYEKGAFVDTKGLACGAVNTSLNPEAESMDDLFVGFWAQVKNVAFAIKDSMISPENGTVFPNWKEFVGTVKFDFPIYEVEDYKELGDISVTYKTATHSTTIKLAPTDWSVNTEDSILTFKLPEAPAAGAMVSVNFAAGIIFDVYGNTNEAFTSEISWKYFSITKDMVLGSFDMAATKADGTYNLGTITIEEDPESEYPDGIILKNFYQEGSEMYGYIDYGKCAVMVETYGIIGPFVNSRGDEYGLITYPAAGEDFIEFTVNPDGTMTSGAWNVVACAPDYSELLGFLDKFVSATMKPAASSAKTRYAAKTTTKKAVKTSAKKNVKKTLKAKKVKSLKKIAK